MLLLIIFLLVLAVSIFLLKKYDNGLDGLGAVLLAISIVGLIVIFVFMLDNHLYDFPENYKEQKTQYDFLLKQDSVPFEIKKDLYNDCAFFNYKVKKSIENNGNIWTGWLYQKPDTTVNCFDLSKFDY